MGTRVLPEIELADVCHEIVELEATGPYDELTAAMAKIAELDADARLRAVHHVGILAGKLARWLAEATSTPLLDVLAALYRSDAPRRLELLYALEGPDDGS